MNLEYIRAKLKSRHTRAFRVPQKDHKEVAREMENSLDGD